MKPAYLIAGTDEAKITRTRGRLRERAEREGGPGALELFEAGEGRRSPDVEARGRLARGDLADRLAPLPARGRCRGLGQGRRRAGGRGARPDPARDDRRAGRARQGRPRGWPRRSRRPGARCCRSTCPRERDLPKQLVADARELGFDLEPAAARLLVERLGPRPMRLRTELERLALWAGEGGQRRRRRSRGDDLRHLGGGDLDPGRRGGRRRRGRDACAWPSGWSRRARRFRGSSTRSLRGCARRSRRRPSWRRGKPGERGRQGALDASVRRQDARLQGQGPLPGGPRRLDPRPRRPRALVARRLGLRRAASPSRSRCAGRSASWPTTPSRSLGRFGTPASSGGGAGDARGAGLLAGARCCDAARPSGRPCRSARRVPCAREAIASAFARLNGRLEPPEIGLHGAPKAQVLRDAHALCAHSASSVRRCWP